MEEIEPYPACNRPEREERDERPTDKPPIARPPHVLVTLEPGGDAGENTTQDTPKAMAPATSGSVPVKMKTTLAAP